MPELRKIDTAASVSNYTPKAGSFTLFYTLQDGNILHKAKKSDGSIVQIAGGGGSSGLQPVIISTSTGIGAGRWYIADTDCTLTLPQVTLGARVAVSTTGDADNVVINAATGEVIIINSTTTDTSFNIDKQHGYVQLLGTASGWVIAMVV